MKHKQGYSMHSIKHVNSEHGNNQGNNNGGQIRRALISVSDKTGIQALASSLVHHGVELLSTGNTAKTLLQDSIPVTEVSDYTGFPEMMDGRLKTLHPKIHGGILGRRLEDAAAMQSQGILPIDLVIVNLYPFITKPSIENIDIGGPALIRAAAKNHLWVTVVVDPEDYAKIIAALALPARTIPLNLRISLAKKAFAHTADYDAAIAKHFHEISGAASAVSAEQQANAERSSVMQSDTAESDIPSCNSSNIAQNNSAHNESTHKGSISESIARPKSLKLTPDIFDAKVDAIDTVDTVGAVGAVDAVDTVDAKEFAKTEYLVQHPPASLEVELPEVPELPEIMNQHWHKTNEFALRYGENPHQKAAFYKEQHCNDVDLDSKFFPVFHLLQGKALSFNNLVDSDTAFLCAMEFNEPACVIVKHANPCGVAVGDTLLTAYEKAFQSDPTSAFGGIIAVNDTLDKELAAKILEKQFVEVVIAPEITEEALALFKTKPLVRIIQCPGNQSPGLEFKTVFGGILVQEKDSKIIQKHDLAVVTQQKPTPAEISDLLFAWKVCKFVKSNAIVFAKNKMTLGIGAGQMSRILSAEIGILRAEREKFSLQGAVMASDAFFPFRDCIDMAAKAGVSTIVQPGGSKRDSDIINAANELGISMVFTQIRHFRH